MSLIYALRRSSFYPQNVLIIQYQNDTVFDVAEWIVRNLQSIPDAYQIWCHTLLTFAIMVETKMLVQYKCILALFMSFVHGRPLGGEYDRDHVHSMEVLAAVTPNDVVNYMNLRTSYGTTNPDGDANPTSARAHTIAMDKKAISFFMPNREKWSMTQNEGNPTQSAGVNGPIKRVK
jgi:hypothetical protein